MKKFQFLVPLLTSGLFMVAPLAGGNTTQHAVTIHFQYGATDLSELYALEDRLEKIISATGTGELDGHEIATDGSNGFLYLYGPNADALVEAIRSILERCPFMGGAEIKKRYGAPGAKESSENLAKK